MTIKQFATFNAAIEEAKDRIKYSPLVHPKRWQGIDVSKKPEAAMHEILNYSFSVLVDPTYLAQDIKPNLPWADDHFAERVGGAPLNPGNEWRNWPYALSADKFRTEEEKFTHTYMERYWPKRAGNRNADDIGIRYSYGDLNDVIKQLAREPDTRQAYLPVWFPEDTGANHGGRVPCTLGYHFLLRNNEFQCTYYLRSCDFVRHFRDDIYLTAKLQLWILDQLKLRNSYWELVKPGRLNMHIVSLHLFRNDYTSLFHGAKTTNG